MYPAEALLQPHHVFAIGGEAKMSWLDYTGMDRPNRNLMQTFPFRRKEFVWVIFARAGFFAQRLPYIPEAKIKPRPRIGRVHRGETKQIMNCAFQTDRRRMARSNAWIPTRFAGVADNDEVTRLATQKRHVNLGGIAPKAEQRAGAVSEEINRLGPTLFGNNQPRPRALPLGHFRRGDPFKQSHGYPSSLATFSNPLTKACGI